jgi:sugar phosphate isomerase/epimerase
MHALGAHSQLFRGSPAEVADCFRRHGLACVELTPAFPGWSFRDPGDFTPARCRHVAEAFQTAGVSVASLASRGNLMDPDLDRRHRTIMHLHALVRHCRAFGTERVVIETGNPTRAVGRKSSSPVSTAAWTELRLILRESLTVAADHGVTLLLKPDRAQLLACPADAARLRAELAHPSLRFVMDPAVYLTAGAPDALAHGLELLFEELGPWAPVAHVKDLRFEPEGITQPPAGRGTLDYGLFCSLLRRYQPDAPIILEHVRPEELPETIALLQQAQTAARD